MTSLKIAIYSGEGASPVSLPGLLLNATDIIKTNWDQTCQMLLMPGGRDLPYHTALQGEGNRKIRKFVENGGKYLGICAGAYYGASFVEFDLNYPLEVVGKRELAFFLGTASGTAYGRGTFTYENRSGARAAKLETSNDTFYSYYNGGCTFIGDFSSCQVLARFADLPQKPPAIISCKVEKGEAILSGVHLEVSAFELNCEDPHLSALIPLLLSSEEKRCSFFHELL